MTERNLQVVIWSLIIGGIATVAIGIGVGIAVEPVFAAIALLGIVDFALAWAFATGRIGPGTQLRQAPSAGRADVAASAAEGDPDYNPYARED